MALRVLLTVLLASGFACAPAANSGGGDDDDFDPTQCSDPDGDEHGAGEGCRGPDCDETDPFTNDGCGENCGDEPATGCFCDSPEAVSCWMGGADAVPGEGACEAGTRVCSKGIWLGCADQVLPDTEVCNHVDDDCDGQTDEGVANPDGTCEGAGGDCKEERARWVYVLSSDDTLLKFEPDSERFTEVGVLDCPAPAGWKPYSMAVDRNGDAWVVYRDLSITATDPGLLYRASTADASCVDVGYSPPDGFGTYGMGFSADAEGGESETLFIGGGDGLPGSGAATLGSLDLSDFAATDLGSIGSWPELTGTGDAQLWGFFPNDSPATIQQLDKSNADAIQTLNLADVSFPVAWAFAFWGGRFYVFLQTLLDPFSKVIRVDLDGGNEEEIVPDTGYQIVGAGVSTCAPVELI